MLATGVLSDDGSGLGSLTYADVCWRMLAYADVCLLQVCSATTAVGSAACHRCAQVCWRMLTYADVCWRMLAYADARKRATGARRTCVCAIQRGGTDVQA